MKLSEKKFLKFTNNKLLVLTIFLGAALVGFTTGNVVAQEVKIGDNSGSPFVSFEDSMSSGMYEIRLNDGTGKFQIWDMTNGRNVLAVNQDGQLAMGRGASLNDDFSLGCGFNDCNFKVLSSDGTAKTTLRSNGNGDGLAKVELRDVTPQGAVRFEMSTQDDGTVCLGNVNGEGCMLIFDIKGPNPGQVKQADGTCIANCP